jgi:hypothetical protein
LKFRLRRLARLKNNVRKEKNLLIFTVLPVSTHEAEIRDRKHNKNIYDEI